MAKEREGGSPVTQEMTDDLLSELRGSSESDRDVFASLQGELRRIARSKMRFERPDHTLQASALVNEAFIKVFRGKHSIDFSHDLATAVRYLSRAMEQILNDHADAHQAKKRGGTNRRRVPIDEQQARDFVESKSWVQIDSALLVKPEQSEQILGVREALKMLRKNSPRQAQIIELQYYGALTQEEVAALLGVSVELVKLDTRKAKAFLRLHLTSKSI